MMYLHRLYIGTETAGGLETIENPIDIAIEVLKGFIVDEFTIIPKTIGAWQPDDLDEPHCLEVGFIVEIINKYEQGTCEWSFGQIAAGLKEELEQETILYTRVKLDESTLL